MMMLNLFFFIKKAYSEHLPGRFLFAYLPHSGDVIQESEPWAKEANPFFSQRPYKS